MNKHLLLVALVCGTLLGCGSNGQPSLGSPVAVTGKLTGPDGKPFGNVNVLLHPVDAPAPATGKVAADGTFTLTTYENKEGACVGKYVVYIQPLRDKDAKLTNAAYRTLPEKYRDEATKSPIEVEIKSSGQQLEITIPAGK